MKNADLAEIRAILKASVPAEKRPTRPLLRAFKALLRPNPPPAPAAAPLPAARRVGVPVEAQAEAAWPELTLGPDEALAAEPDESRRAAFGQRQETIEVAPSRPALALSAPEAISEAEVGEALRRLGSALIRNANGYAVETPDLFEDFADHGGHEAERLYAAAGLPPAPSQPTDGGPESELLTHLERVFLAERAAVEARLLSI